MKSLLTFQNKIVMVNIITESGIKESTEKNSFCTCAKFFTMKTKFSKIQQNTEPQITKKHFAKTATSVLQHRT
jgi:hypothetical protein